MISIPDLSHDFEAAREARRRRQTIPLWYFLLAAVVLNVFCTWGGCLAGLGEEAGQRTFWRAILWGHICSAAGLVAGIGVFLHISLLAFGMSAHRLHMSDRDRAAARSLLAPIGLMYCAFAGLTAGALVSNFVDLPPDASAAFPWFKLAGALIGSLVAAAMLVPIYLVTRER